MKVAVYTIALNEAAHAERWASSAVDADYRVVVDTGSTDDTVERLTRAGVTVHRIAVRPWRFDVARNTALALLPDDVDVCVSLDMDRFLEAGWRHKLEAAWTPDMTALFCKVVYRASVDDPRPLRGWMAKNFHHRWGYRFKRPVHEALVYSGPREVTGSCEEIICYEVQDLGKTTRNQYLPLMELALREDPEDAQICFWLARDHMWGGQADRAVELLQRYLSLPASTWNDERAEAMRYLARLQPDHKMAWLDKARLEAPHRREIWLDIAEELHTRSDWLNLFWACSNGIEKTRRTGSYLDDTGSWGFRLFDLGAIAAWHLNTMDRAVEWGGQALALDPENQRLRGNLDFFIRRREEQRVVSQPAQPALPRRETRPDGTVVHGVVEGQNVSFLVTNPSDEIMKCHDSGAFYEVEELGLMMRHGTGTGVFVDIGANVGNHSVYMSRFSRWPRIIAFEPNPTAIAVLKTNVTLNRCDNVDLRHLGLALAAGPTRLQPVVPDPNNLGHTLLREDPAGPVAGVAGDELLLDEPVTFIKLDVEGMEIDILAGLERTIRRWQPALFVEVWDAALGPFVDWCERQSYLLVDRYRRYETIENFLVKPFAEVLAAARDTAPTPAFRDAASAVLDRPDDAGVCRRLAEAYRDLGKPFEAAVLFERCHRRGGDTEEGWYGLWQKARCLRQAGGETAFVAAAEAAFRQRPQRGEPLHDLARHYLGRSRGDLALVHADAGLALAVPAGDGLGVEPEVYETGLKEAFAIAASYASDAADKERGRRICDWLALRRDVPASVRGLARHNSRWYAVAAQALMPSLTFHPLSVQAPEGYRPGNVSLTRHGAGFAALVRCVNYTLGDNGYFDRHGDSSFRQRILWAALDETLRVVSSTEVLPPRDLPPPRHADSLGFEDPRPFLWRGALWCVSCVRQLNEQGRAEMVLARIDGPAEGPCILADWRILDSSAPPRWEKNWMPQVVGDELRFVYSLDPTRLLDDAGRVLLEEPAAVAADNFRGGSQAVPFDGGWLTLVHEWEMVSGRRNYLHRFAWLDADGRLARLSRRFYFQRVSNEFGAGLAWDASGARLVLGFAIDDRDPTLGVVPADEVRALLASVAENAAASRAACEAGRPAWEALRSSP